MLIALQSSDSEKEESLRMKSVVVRQQSSLRERFQQLEGMPKIGLMVDGNDHDA